MVVWLYLTLPWKTGLCTLNYYFYFDANGISDAAKQQAVLLVELLWTFNVLTTVKSSVTELTD